MDLAMNKKNIFTRLSLSSIFLLFIMGCRPEPCPGSKEKNVGLYSKELGTVQIDNEYCKIFETYNVYECIEVSSREECGGYICNSKILTRITKCPSSTTTNTITYTPDKFHREEVK